MSANDPLRTTRSQPSGACLRASFTADNHGSLGDDGTRSMLHLSHEAKTAPMRLGFAVAAFPLAEEARRG
jgi:hypothetical protein